RGSRALGVLARHAVAVAARLPEEDLPAALDRLRLPGLGALLRTLVGQPALEVRGRLGDYADEHVGVLRAAKLSTLAEEQAGLVRLKPHMIGAARDQVGLAREPGHAVAVGHV